SVSSPPPVHVVLTGRGYAARHGHRRVPGPRRPAPVPHRRALLRVLAGADRPRPGAGPARPAPAALVPDGAGLGLPPLRRHTLPAALRGLPCLRRGAHPGAALPAQPQPAPLPGTQRIGAVAGAAGHPYRQTARPVPALP